jgi:hypothetical protein
MKTAVEWLVEKTLTTEWHTYKSLEFIEQAKEMEKQQIVDAYIEGRFDSDKIVMSDKFYAEQYYEDKFNK